MVSVIIPVYNESKTIVEIINRITVIDLDKDIVVVDDGSTDGTGELLKTINDPRIKVITHERNYGKGRAVRTGIKAADGGIILIQDADLEYDPGDYPKLIEPIVSGKADVVYGSRCYDRMTARDKIFNIFMFGRWFLTKAANILYGARITDEPCGYKVFRSEVLKSIPLTSDRFGFCPEVTAKLSRRGYKIHEVKVNYNPRRVWEGKKITLRDGIEAVCILLKYRFWT